MERKCEKEEIHLEIVDVMMQEWTGSDDGKASGKIRFSGDFSVCKIRRSG